MSGSSKGKVIASNGQGSVSTYEVGKMLERVGLTINDVELKILPFTQMAVAFANKAIDGAIVIPPFVWQLAEQKIAVPFADVDQLVEPRPMTIAVIMINTDWAKKNPDLVRNYVTAWMLRRARLLPGLPRRLDARSDRRRADRPAVPNAGPSCCTNIRGRRAARTARINVASMLDIQAWYVKHKLANKEFPAERLVDTSYAEHAARQARTVRAGEGGQHASGVPVASRSSLPGLTRQSIVLRKMDARVKFYSRAGRRPDPVARA